MTTALSTKPRLLVLGLALVGGALALALTIPGGPGPKPAGAASHREAPAISLDGPADITDFFMFRSYETGKSDKVVLIMDVQSEEPSSGPNYWNFDPGVVYSFHVDNDRDGRADDVRFDFRFKTEIRGTADALGLFNPYIGGAGGLPPITSLDGPGSEGIGLRQKYTVTMSHSGGGDNDDDDDGRQVLARGLIAVPSNVGPRTMPDYEALADQGIYDVGSGVRVFAGQRQDPFYIDLGAVFDTLNLRRPVPALTEAEDANDSMNPFGTDMLSGFNVSTIALEIPSTMLTMDEGETVLGAYASTSRRGIRVDDDDGGGWKQVQRLANPLINETIIGVEDKDRWNALAPHREARFLDYYLRSRLALELQLVFGVPTGCTAFGSPACEPNPPSSEPFPNWNRDDLVNVLLKYQPTDTRLSELLRLNLMVPPTPLAAQKRMTVLAGDNAGWPNGRRPKDDVTDIAVRVIGGPNYIVNRIGDGVNTDDVANTAEFPFIGTPWDGRDRQHDNP
jgi:Domain of unknown function (DUF4331)